MLNATVLRLLEIEVPLPKSVSQSLHFLLDAHQLVRQGLLHVARLHREDALEGILLAPQNLHLLLVVVELVRDVPNLLLS